MNTTNMPPDELKQTAINLINQLIDLEKTNDLEHRKLLAEKRIFPKGDSAVGFHLKILLEIIEKL